MQSKRHCPICTETFEAGTKLTIHLEVEHRKSELVTQLVENRIDDHPAPPP